MPIISISVKGSNLWSINRCFTFTIFEFIKKYRIDFIDIISEVEVEADEEANYYDGYLDNCKIYWKNVIEEIEGLKNIKKICFTRKTFSDIPNMKIEIEKIKIFAKNNKIDFQYLTTPARFYSESKQKEWTDFLTNDQ